jgi:cell division septum initiation protein DivIVA
MMQNVTEPDSLAPTTGGAPDSTLAVAVSHLPDTRSVEFTNTGDGAYDRLEVDRFLGQLTQALDEVRAATTSTGQELAALRAENARLRDGSGADFEEEITAGAMGLLTQAQLIADKAIADAEQYARDLVLTARTQYREILDRAEASASEAAATVGAQQQQVQLQGPAVPEIEYVRTYAHVAQIQLRSVLEALTEQVDRLGTLPQPVQEPQAVSRPDADEGPTGEPDWAPTSAVPVTHQG